MATTARTSPMSRDGSIRNPSGAAGTTGWPGEIAEDSTRTRALPWWCGLWSAARLLSSIMASAAAMIRAR